MISELKEMIITREDYIEYLSQRLRLQGSAQHEVENVGFPFLFASGSELLRSYILTSTEFFSTLPEELKIPDRGFAWYLFSQSVKEVHVTQESVMIKYQLQKEYRKPFKQFYI
jgi:hypothetical protein